MIKNMKTTIVLLACLFCSWSAQGQISDEQAVRAIVGEASNQGFAGMRAVASAIRNRGTLKGVYGLNAKHNARESKATWDLARRAWAESAKVDVVGGSTHWDNIRRFGKPYWASSMDQVMTVRDHVFYRSKRT